MFHMSIKDQDQLKTHKARLNLVKISYLILVKLMLGMRTKVIRLFVEMVYLVGVLVTYRKSIPLWLF